MAFNFNVFIHQMLPNELMNHVSTILFHLQLHLNYSKKWIQKMATRLIFVQIKSTKQHWKCIFMWTSHFCYMFTLCMGQFVFHNISNWLRRYNESDFQKVKLKIHWLLISIFAHWGVNSLVTIKWFIGLFQKQTQNPSLVFLSYRAIHLLKLCTLSKFADFSSIFDVLTNLIIDSAQGKNLQKFICFHLSSFLWLFQYQLQISVLFCEISKIPDFLQLEK